MSLHQSAARKLVCKRDNSALKSFLIADISNGVKASLLLCCPVEHSGGRSTQVYCQPTSHRLSPSWRFHCWGSMMSGLRALGSKCLMHV